MMTFKEFMNEKKKVEAKGNYVSINATLDKGDVSLYNGIFTKQAHVTLMYSENSNVEGDKIKEILDQYKANIESKFIGVDIFDDNDGLYAVVLKLESKELLEIHDKLISLGMKHSYEYTPHLTFAYKLTKDNAELLKKDLDNKFNNQSFILSGFNIDEIKKDWVTSND